MYLIISYRDSEEVLLRLLKADSGFSVVIVFSCFLIVLIDSYGFYSF